MNIDSEVFEEEYQKDLANPDAPLSFFPDTDAKRDWCVRRIKETRADYDRMIAIQEGLIDEGKLRKERLQDEREQKVSYLIHLLEASTVDLPMKETKTQSTYKLLSGTLVKKKPGIEYERNDDAIVEYLQKAGRDDLLQYSVKPKWADIKKELTVADEELVDFATGEIAGSEKVATIDGLKVPGIIVKEKPEEFDVK